jgi:hypothetical protein
MIKKIRYTNHVTGEVREVEYIDDGSVVVTDKHHISIYDLTVGEMLDIVNTFDGGIVSRNQYGLYTWRLLNEDCAWTVEVIS